MRHLLSALILFPFLAFGASREVINVGNRSNDNLGDDLRTSWQKANTNFYELFSRTDAAATAGGITDPDAAWTQLAIPEINVKLRGDVAGDGSTDDTTGIQAVLTAAPSGSTIRFPDGTYMASTLTLPANKNLRIAGGSRTIIKQLSTATDALFITAGTDVATLRFSDITLDGNAANQTGRYEDQVNHSSIIATLHENKRLFCDGVTFTNSIRAAVRVAGPARFSGCEFLNVKRNSMYGNGTPGDTYAIFAQPTGSASNLSFAVDGCRFEGADTTLAEVYLAAHGIFITEESAGDLAVYDQITIVNSHFVGLGGWYGVSEGAAIEIYNGSKRVVVSGNHVTKFAQSAIKVQRTDCAIISNNTIEDGLNAYDGDGGIYEGVSQAIIYDPSAREGYTPFTGIRTNELHYSAVIANNIIRNVQETAIYTTGAHVLIQGNIIDGVIAGQVLAAISVLNSDVDVIANSIRNVTGYGIVATGPYSKIRVLENKMQCSDATSADGQFVFSGIDLLTIKDNLIEVSEGSSTTAVYIDNCERLKIIGNDVLNATVGFRISGTAGDTDIVLMSDNSAYDCETECQFVDTVTHLKEFRNTWCANGVKVQSTTQSAFTVEGANASAGVSMSVFQSNGGKYLEMGVAGGGGEFLPGTVAGDGFFSFSGTNLFIGKPGTVLATMDNAGSFTFKGTPTKINGDGANLTLLQKTAGKAQYMDWYSVSGSVYTQRGWAGFTQDDGTLFQIRNLQEGAISLNTAGSILLGPGPVTASTNVIVQGTLYLQDGTSKAVTVGASDSGGTGYKLLRVAN